jgi:hypothetical protein
MNLPAFTIPDDDQPAPAADPFAPGAAMTDSENPTTVDRMLAIDKLIEMCQSIKDRWGNTCVYIRRGGMTWGAVALNAQADDEKHGVFDLQAAHDRDRERHLGQVKRLMDDRDRWRDRALAAEALPQFGPR